jgi:hypothetical protein
MRGWSLTGGTFVAEFVGLGNALAAAEWCGPRFDPAPRDYGFARLEGSAMTADPILNRWLAKSVRNVAKWRDDQIENMVLEVLARPECYNVERLMLVTYQEDSIFDPAGERIELHRRAAGRNKQIKLAEIRLVVLVKGLV